MSYLNPVLYQSIAPRESGTLFPAQRGETLTLLNKEPAQRELKQRSVLGAQFKIANISHQSKANDKEHILFKETDYSEDQKFTQLANELNQAQKPNTNLIQSLELELHTLKSHLNTRNKFNQDSQFQKEQNYQKFIETKFPQVHTLEELEALKYEQLRKLKTLETEFYAKKSLDKNLSQYQKQQAYFGNTAITEDYKFRNSNLKYYPKIQHNFEQQFEEIQAPENKTLGYQMLGQETKPPPVIYNSYMFHKETQTIKPKDPFRLKYEKQFQEWLEKRYQTGEKLPELEHNQMAILKWVFQKLDKNKSNYVEKVELLEAIQNNQELKDILIWDKSAKDEDYLESFHEFFNQIDTQKISIDQFLNFFKKTWHQPPKIFVKRKEKEEQENAPLMQHQQIKSKFEGTGQITGQTQNIKQTKDVMLLRFFFNNIDKNKSGYVDKLELLEEFHKNEEIARIFGLYEQVKSDKYLDNFQEIYSSIDTDKKNEISWEEFLQFFELKKNQDIERKQYLEVEPTKFQQKTTKKKQKVKQEKSKSVLNKRQLEVLEEVFSEFFQEDQETKLVNRQDFVQALRNDIRCIKMHATDAAQLSNDEIYTFEQVLEKIEMHQIAADDLIQWEEFMNYFTNFHQFYDKTYEDFRADSLQLDPSILQILKEVYENIPKLRNEKVQTHNYVQFVRSQNDYQYFMNNIAREPQGISTIPAETVDQVLERMEVEADWLVDWKEIRSYFTVQGKPREIVQETGYYSDPEIDTHRVKEHGQFMRESWKLSLKAQEAPSRTSTQIKAAKKEFQEKNKTKENNNFQITVPQPFAFDERDKQKQKSQYQQPEEPKYRFRAKPVPADVMIPKLHQIMEANQERRNQVKKTSIEMTKAREKPFSF